MPVATATLTGDLGALPVGQEFQPSALRAWVETNLPKSAVLVDTSTGGQVHLGPWVLDLDADGKFSQSGLPRSGTGDTNPSTFQYRVVVEYEDPVTRRAQRWHSTYFTLDSATASLNTILGEQYAPPEWHPVSKSYVDAHINNPTGAHAATAISFQPSSGIAAVNVQSAIVEAKADAAADATNKANAAEAAAAADATAKANAAETAAKNASVPRALIDGKGDLIVGTANDTPARLPAPTAGQELIGNPSGPEGLEWRDRPTLLVNLVRNPFFRVESGVLGGWHAGSGSTLSLDNTRAYEGTHSLKVVRGSGGAWTAGFNIPDVQAGQWITFFARVWGEDSASSLLITASGVQASSVSTGPAAGWMEHRVSVQAPMSQLYVARLNMGSPSGSVAWLDTALVVVGDLPVNVGSFDGDTPGAAWTGGWAASPSVRSLVGPEDWQRVDRTIYGTGSPEGAVAAPVGWEYVDEAATNGALVWRKWSGTGATGWRVEQGDTGWRDITALADPDVLTSGAVHVRRTGPQIHIRIMSLSSIAGSDQLLVALPSGLRPDSATRMPLQMGPTTTQVRFTGNGSNMRVGSAGTIAETVYVSLPVTSAWPATLPGTPV